MSEQEPEKFEIKPSMQAMEMQLNDQAAQILHQQVVMKEMMLQIQLRDQMLAEKTKPSKRTTAKKKPSDKP